MERKEIKETITAAGLYLNKLENLKEEISLAQSQILNSSETAEGNIDKLFENIQQVILNLLSNRKQVLKNQIVKIKEKSIKPLTECQEVVSYKIKRTKDFLKLGENLVKERNDAGLDLFVRESSLLGSLPAVPALTEVPYVCFSYENNLESSLENIVEHLGEVLKTSPVQITQMVEKPGGIFIEWQLVDLNDNWKDVYEFHLQKAIKCNLPNFETCYIGSDNQYLVKDVNINQPYLFRVNCKFEGSHQDCPWSLPQSFKTTLKPFSWSKNSDCSISADGKIGKLLNEPSFIISDGAQFKIGHMIEFTVLEMDNEAASIGIVESDEIHKITKPNFIEQSTLVLSSNGKIFLEGTEKSTQFPKLKKNSKVSLTSELVKNNKILIHIDLEEKRATYELNIDENCQFFFFANVPSQNWKIMVE